MRLNLSRSRPILLTLCHGQAATNLCRLHSRWVRLSDLRALHASEDCLAYLENTSQIACVLAMAAKRVLPTS